MHDYAGQRHLLMSRAIKAALLSGLVFPGSGHAYLKKYRMALVLVSVTLLCITLLIMEAVDRATKILEELEASGMAINSANIMEISVRAAEAGDHTLTNTATLIIVLCWFIGVIDAYRSGKRTEQTQHSPE